MLARPLRPCASAHAPCVLLQGMFGGAFSFNGDLSNWDTSSVTNMQVRAIALAVICVYPPIISRRTPRISNIFDSLRLLSSHIYRRGKHAGAEVSPVRREPRACARTPTPPVRLRSCTVCCCIICLLILLLCPTATNAPSMIRSQRHQLIGPILYLEHQPVLLIALSNCNKIAIDDSFNKANNNWPYTSWRTVTCDVY